MPKSPFIAAVAAVVALIALPDAASAAPKKKLLRPSLEALHR